MEFAVTTSTKVAIDKTSWNAWLIGLGVDQAVDYLLAQYKVRQVEIPSRSHATLFVLTQYRQFEMLDLYLSNPKSLTSQLLFPLDKSTLQYLIDSYYSYDVKVMRELIGKKLNQRARKDLEDVCQKTNVPIVGCRRMFDNVKRVMKRVEDIEGPIVETIARHFLIPLELAQSYASIMFLNQHKIDTTKRRLAHFRFEDFEYAASIFASYFAVVSSTPDEIDASIAHDARDLKTILFNHKESIEPFRTTVTQELEKRGHKEITEKSGLNCFRILLRNILVIGSGIGNSKEFRDILTSIQEKVVDVSNSFGWTKHDLDVFLDVVLFCFQETGAGLNDKVQRRFKRAFSRLVQGIRLVSVRFYQ